MVSERTSSASTGVTTNRRPVIDWTARGESSETSESRIFSDLDRRVTKTGREMSLPSTGKHYEPEEGRDRGRGIRTTLEEGRTLSFTTAIVTLKV